MRSTLFRVAGATFLAVLFSSAELYDDGYAGRTGAPGEQTCVNGCHNTYALNSGDGSVTLGSTNMTGWSYVPGTTYHMTVTVALSTSNLYGLGVECLTAAGTNAGTLTVTHPAETKVLNATVQGNSRRNIVHQLNGGIGTGSMTFSFDWTAPATDIGSVTFYYAGNAANGNGANSGDRIYTGSQVITAANTTGLDELAWGGHTTVIAPMPFIDHCTVAYSMADAGPVSVAVLDLDGRLLQHHTLGLRTPGRHTERLEAMEQLAAGTYLVRLNAAGTSSLHKVVKAAH